MGNDRHRLPYDHGFIPGDPELMAALHLPIRRPPRECPVCDGCGMVLGFKTPIPWSRLQNMTPQRQGEIILERCWSVPCPACHSILAEHDKENSDA